MNSFAFPYALGSRAAATTTYRTAIVGGKTIPFKQPTTGDGFSDRISVPTAVFITSCGTWKTGAVTTLWYKGSIVALYYSHQAAGSIQVLQYRLQPALSRLQLPDRVPDSELAAAANADVPRHQYARLHAARFCRRQGVD